jgi:uncharacterized protein (TIGR02646 family)
MIHVAKSPIAPAILLNKGAQAALEHCEHHDASPEAYRTGDRKFEFKRAVYAAKAVKQALRRDQHGKCAFCESSFEHIAVGDVEHFRPKAGFKQVDSDDLKRPGYFWLAYEWSNLFLSCELCNQLFKKNLFPLKNARRRAHPVKLRIDQEEPLLIDPAAIDPSNHIHFNREYAVAKDGSPEGSATIEALGLNRQKLAEIRGQRLDDLEGLVDLCNLLRDQLRLESSEQTRAQLSRWESMLNEKQHDSAEYAAMARAFLNR